MGQRDRKEKGTKGQKDKGIKGQNFNVTLNILGQKKSRNVSGQKISRNLSGQKNHATSRDK